MPERPLAGKRIAITRPEEQAQAVTDRLRDLGAEAIAAPIIAIAPMDDNTALDAALARVATYDWVICTSANGVRAVFDRLIAQSHDASALRASKIGAIGPATAQAFRAHGITPDFMPSAYVAESMLDEIGPIAGQRVLLPCADIARETLAVGLRDAGAQVDAIAAYRTIPGAGVTVLADRLEAGTIDAITFTSASTVRYLLDDITTRLGSRDAARELVRHAAILCIGPITADAVSDEGLHIDGIAHEYTTDGLIAALLRFFQ